MPTPNLKIFIYGNPSLEVMVLATSDLDKCNLLNEYFVSLFTTDDGILPSFAHRSPVTASLGSVSFIYDVTYDSV